MIDFSFNFISFFVSDQRVNWYFIAFRWSFSLTIPCIYAFVLYFSNRLCVLVDFIFCVVVSASNHRFHLYSISSSLTVNSEGIDCFRYGNECQPLPRYDVIFVFFLFFFFLQIYFNLYIRTVHEIDCIFLSNA